MTSICSSCCNDLTNITTNETSPGPPDASIQVRPKEVFILVLFFLLLLYSVISFLSQWNKNYREINHLPYYEIYIEKNSELQGMWNDRTSLSRTDSRISRIVYNHPNFVSKARRAQSCGIQNSRKSRMSRRRSLGASDEFRLEEIVTIEDEDKAKNCNFTKPNTIIY